MIETIRAFKSTEPYTHLKEFRPLALEDWSEKIEGDTKVNIKVDEKTGQDLISKYAGPFSQIVSLQNSDPIRHDRDTPAYTNHVTNPSFEGYSGAVDVRRNLAIIPKPRNAGDVSTSNTVWSYENNQSSVSYSNGEMVVVPAILPAGSIVGINTGTTFGPAGLQHYAQVVAGTTVTVSLTVEVVGTGQFGFYMRTRNQNDRIIKRGTQHNLTAGRHRISETFVVPEDTTAIDARNIGTGVTAGVTQLRFTEYMVEEVSVPLPYFDGSTRGEFGTKTLREQLCIAPRLMDRVDPDRFSSLPISQSGGLERITDSTAPSGVYIKQKVHNLSFFGLRKTAGSPSNNTPNTAGPIVKAGEVYTFSLYLRSRNRTPGGVDPYAFARWHIRDINGNAIGQFRQGPNIYISSDEWQRVDYTLEIPEGAHYLLYFWEMRGGDTNPDTEVHYTSPLVEKTDKPLPYFDGSYAPNPDSQYKPEWLGAPDASESVLRAGSADLTPRWTGTPNNSPSALAGTLPANTRVGNNDAVIAWESTVNPRNGPTHVRAMARNNIDTASIYFYGTEGISAGDEISTGISIRPQYPVTFYIRGPKTEDGMDLFQEDIEPGNDYTEYKVQGIASEYTTGDPGGATLEFSNVGIGHDWEAGTYIDFDNYFVYKGITDHPYKDGDTAGWYWNGQPHASTSSSYERLAVENYIYDSYYIQKIIPDPRGRTYTLECVGIKEYLDYRLAIPAGMNPANGVITIPDGSVEEKPIPTSQRLYLRSRTYKGIIKGLIDETRKLEELPLEISDEFTAGTRERNYLLKDLRTIKEAIDNIIGNQEGPDVIFDGGFGDASQPKFFMTADTPIRRGEIIELSSRKSEIFRPDVEVNQNEYVNNLWVAGNTSDGNMLLAHKTVPAGSGPLLQRANTQRSDISTSAFLLDYTLGIIEMAGSEIRAMRLRATNTKKFFQARPGYIFYLKAPEDLTIHNTLWKIVEREIRREQIVFDLVEVTL